MREKYSDDGRSAERERITPACAGKTACVRGRVGGSWDHPRVCGKNLFCFSSIASTLGSPPRVREKPEATKGNIAQVGITPACAGKTASATSPVRLRQDHPRVCGKNIVVLRDIQVYQGSPPRVREKQFLHQC